VTTPNPSSTARRRSVVGVDGTPCSDLALDWAVADATRRGISLHVVHTYVADYPTMTVASPPMVSDLRAVGQTVLHTAMQRARDAEPGLSLTGSVRAGSAARHLVEESTGADLVVVGTQGRRGLARLLLGSTAAQVAAHAHCPVAVVRAAARTSSGPARVVVGIDVDGVSHDAVEQAFAQADARGADLTAVHAWSVPTSGVALVAPLDGPTTAELAVLAGQVLDDALAGWSDKHPQVAVTRVVTRSDAVDALVEQSADADLLVVGSRGRGGFTGLLLGSVSQHLLQTAHCPVLVVRPGSQQHQGD
jgi:nucleotide-binding universal stress UspA family protein